MPNGIPHKRKEYRKSFGDISPPPLARSSERSTTGSLSIIPQAANMPRAAVLSSPKRTGSHSGRHEASRGPESQRQPIEYSLTDMITQLKKFEQQMDKDQENLTIYKLQDAFQGFKAASDRRIQSGDDLFAGCRKPPLLDQQEDTMCIELRHQTKGKQSKQEQHHLPVLCDTEMESVPDYMYRYVSIAKNLLAPASDQAQISQNFDFKTKKDRQDFENRVAEIKENNTKLWNSEPLKKQEIFDLTTQLERSHAIAPYMQTWLEELKVSVPALLSAQLSRKDDRATRAAHAISRPQENAVQFTKAFDEVFTNSKPASRDVNLNRVLQLAHLDGSEVNLPKDIDEQTHTFLLSYCFQSCLICHQYACEHGEYNSENLRERIKFPHVPELLSVRRQDRVNIGRSGTPPAKICVCQRPESPPRNEGTPWTAEEQKVLMMTSVTSEDHINMDVDPACIVATTLSRSCEEVRRKLQGMSLSKPKPDPLPPCQPKPLPFYDRHKKRLIGDWNKKLMSHRYAERRLVDRSGCHHEGPCTVEVCPCRQLKLLCEKYCGCTESSCAAKFTGCGCKSAAHNCTDRRCICIQLERECDPDLCGGCGIVEQCDPWRHPRPDNKVKRCSNSDLQTAQPKATVKADSEIEAAGMGLLLAEAASKGEFVIEYIGEWEPYDEGERRTIRRDNADVEFNAPSYLFTVLGGEAFEIDSAAYGNMARYANSAPVTKSPGTKHTANLVPQIVYVNGEFRIKLVATRDIKVGEELFFSYGTEYFGKGKQTTKQKKSVSEADKRIAKARAPIQRMTVVPDIDAETDLERQLEEQSDKRGHTPGSLPYRESEIDDTGSESESESDNIASDDVGSDQNDSDEPGSASASRPRRLGIASPKKQVSKAPGRGRRRDSRGDCESTRPKKQQRIDTYELSLRTVPSSLAFVATSSQASGSQEQRRTRSSARFGCHADGTLDDFDTVRVVQDSQEDDGEELVGHDSLELDDAEKEEEEEVEDDDEESEEDSAPSQLRRSSQRVRRRPRRFKSVAFDAIRK